MKNPIIEIPSSPVKLSSEARARTIWVDAAKGVSIMMILAHHSLEGLETAGFVGTAVERWHQLLSPVLLPLFFLIGGLYARRSIEGPLKDFVNSKILNFLYLYVIWSVISQIVRVLANPVTNNKSYISDLLYIAWDPVLTVWFIYGLVLSFIITRLVRRIDPIITIAFAATIQAASFVFPDVPYLDILNKVAVLYVYFAIGVYAADYIFSMAENVKLLAIVVSTSTFSIIGYLCVVYNIVYQPLTYFTMSCLAIYAICGLMARIQCWKVGRALAFVGFYSLPIYLLHFIPVPGSRIFIAKVFGITDPILLLIVAVAAGVAFGIGGYLILVKTPLKILFERPSWLHISQPENR